MGAPKQKWTNEEESALKAGIAKHGAGKWRTILRDPEFSAVLSLRSNVDLKDKWRNMNVLAAASSSGSRIRIPPAKKSRLQLSVDLSDELAMTSGDLTTSLADISDGNEILDAVPLAMSASGSENQENLQICQSAKISASKLGNIVMEAIRALKDPNGSNKTAIAEYIEDQYWVPADFKELLSAKLKDLSSSGKLIRVKRKYIIATHPFQKQPKTPTLLLEESQSQPYPSSSADEKVKVKLLTRADVDAELARMRGMSAEQAAEVAARVVEEAEVIMAEAEMAAREAELAEAEAEAALAFAESAGAAMKNRNANKLTIRA